MLNPLNSLFNLAGRCCRLSGQLFDFIGDYRKTLPRFASPGRLNGGIERQQIHLFGDIGDGLNHLANIFGRFAQFTYLHRGIFSLQDRP